ncbi:MAG: SDR family oxidoreductase [Saprospirales bacterium]|nr:MAG: SDR family oxidoreductase [Saprospirales bacterium]
MNILITGASSGIGYATCLELSKNNINRIFAISRNLRKLESLQEECHKQNRNKIEVLSFDLSHPDWDQLAEFLKDIQSIDLLINNAGLLYNKPFLETGKKDWEELLNVNLVGPAILIRQLFPFLKAAEQAHVVNISSMGGFQGSKKFPGLAAYSSSKAALACLTECLVEELEPEGISVNCLCLGAVATEMLANAFPGYKAPLTADEMGKFLADFGTGGHRFFNGQIIPVALSNPG